MLLQLLLCIGSFHVHSGPTPSPILDCRQFHLHSQLVIHLQVLCPLMTDLMSGAHISDFLVSILERGDFLWRIIVERGDIVQNRHFPVLCLSLYALSYLWGTRCHTAVDYEWLLQEELEHCPQLLSTLPIYLLYIRSGRYSHQYKSTDLFYNT